MTSTQCVLCTLHVGTCLLHGQAGSQQRAWTAAWGSNAKERIPPRLGRHRLAAPLFVPTAARRWLARPDQARWQRNTQQYSRRLPPCGQRQGMTRTPFRALTPAHEAGVAAAASFLPASHRLHQAPRTGPKRQCCQACFDTLARAAALSRPPTLPPSRAPHPENPDQLPPRFQRAHFQTRQQAPDQGTQSNTSGGSTQGGCAARAQADRRDL